MTVGWFMKALLQYSDFHSRARRREFWWFVLLEYFIFWFMLSMFGAMAVQAGAFDDGTFDSSRVSTAAWIFYWGGLVVALALVVPYFAVTVRRLHDTGRSGWWSVFLLFLPIVVWILALFDGDPQPNQYGEDPKHLER